MVGLIVVALRGLGPGGQPRLALRPVGTQDIMRWRKHVFARKVAPTGSYGLVRRLKRTPVRHGMAGDSCVAAHVVTYHFIQRRKSIKRLWSSKHSYRHLTRERCTVGKVLTVVPYFTTGQPLDERLGHNKEKRSFLRDRI